MSNLKRGFTLVEILVALTILAITMGAYLSQLDSQIIQTQSARDRTLAHWVAQNHLANMRLTKQWPSTGSQNYTAKQGQQTWQINQQVTATPNAKIKRIELTMFSASGDFSGSLVGYVTNER